MNEISAKKLIGMPVFSINEGEEFGHIRQLIMDPAAKQLLAIVICSRGRCRDTKIVATGKIVGIGSDAVTISEKNAAARAANLPRMIKYMHRPNNILGNKIISENGYNLGKAEGYYLNTANGSISRLDIAAGSRGNIFAGKCRISGKHILTIGPAAIVLSRQALEEIEQIENPLKINLQNAKLRAERAAETTLDTSRKISRVIAEKLSKRNESKEKLQSAENPQTKPDADNHLPAENLTLPVNTADITADITTEEIPTNEENGADDLAPSLPDAAENDNIDR